TKVRTKCTKKPILINDESTLEIMPTNNETMKQQSNDAIYNTKKILVSAIKEERK
ncbi:13824_t:CDS:1, partial [Gigaspora margarita]